MNVFQMNGKKQISQFIKRWQANDKNYRPVSLLLTCSKIFEKIIFNSLFKYLEDNKLLNCNQSGFLPDDSCVYQFSQ